MSYIGMSKGDLYTMVPDGIYYELIKLHFFKSFLLTKMEAWVAEYVLNYTFLTVWGVKLTVHALTIEK